ncbi:MAG TPA: RDD family protein [Arenimonas sp.]|nr:RDD family protein [Arenimonas sp.]
MTQWYYADAGEQLGPVAADVLGALARQGRIGPDTLVWREGWSQWRPLSEAAAELGVESPSMATATSTPPPAPAAERPTLPMAGAAEVVQAGFWRRFAALFIDALILSAVFYTLLFVVILVVGIGSGFEGFEGDEPPLWFTFTFVLLGLGYYPMAACYYALQESGPHQATLGKRALGIKVCDLEGRRLDRGHAFGRWLAAALSYLTLYIGFLMAAFTARKQALHDFVASTQVVDRWAYSEYPDRQQSSPSGCLIAVVAAALLAVGLAVLGILAAIAIPAYSDYTGRAGVSTAMHAAGPVKSAIEEFVPQTDRCPRDWDELGMAAPSHPSLAAVEVGELDDGRCVIELQLGQVPGAPGVAGQHIWLSRLSEGVWDCSSDLESPRYLPASCR